MAPYSFQGVDLDLEKLEHDDDPVSIANTVGKLIDADSDYKVFPARTWIDNFLYYAGVRDFYNRLGTGTVTGQTLINFGNLQGYGGSGTHRRRISKTFKACQVQAANITRQKPSVKVWAESDEEESNKDAKLANITLDFLWDFDFEDDIYYEAILWALLTPAVSRKDFLDYSFSAPRIWPEMQDVQNPYTGEMEQTVKQGPNGPILQQHPWNKTQLISAFRLITNFGATWLHDIEFIGDYGTERIDTVRQNYNRNEEGFFPENVAKLTAGNWKFTPTMAMENALKQLAFGA